MDTCLFALLIIKDTISEPHVILSMDVINLYLIGYVNGSSVNGVITNGPVITFGQHDGALETNGVNQSVNFGDHRTQCFHLPDRCNMGVTYAVWLQRMRWASLEVFVDTGGYYLASIGYAMVQNAHGRMVILVHYQTHYYRATVLTWPLDRWGYIVWTWDVIEGITVYMNGCRLGPDIVTYSVQRRTHAIAWYVKFVVGSSALGFYHSRMKMDDFVIWHRVLAENQVWQLYVNGGNWQV